MYGVSTPYTACSIAMYFFSITIIMVFKAQIINILVILFPSTNIPFQLIFTFHFTLFLLNILDIVYNFLLIP